MECLAPLSAYLSLFAISFLASTILPGASELVLVNMLIADHSPFCVVSVATVGNTLGSWTTYALGLFGGRLLLRRMLHIHDESVDRAKRFYARFGAWSLLFSWAPIVGDPLCAVAGLFRAPWLLVVTLVLVGKLARYMVVAWLTLAVPA